MQYVVIVTSRHAGPLDIEGKRRSYTTQQTIACDGITHAKAVADVMTRARLFNHSEAAVRIWNGKANVSIPLDAIEQVYAEMTDPQERVAAE